MFSYRSGAARGQVRTAYIVAAACIGIVLAVPAWFGGRAERIYRDSIAQLAGAGHTVSLDTYRRGWFSSLAVVRIAAGRGAITLTQHVHHGPFGFYDGWRPAFPVAAIIDTDPPPVLQSGLDKVFGDAPIVISTVVGMSGTLDTYISRAATGRTDPARQFSAKFGGFDAQLHLSQDAYTIRADAPGADAAGTFGEAAIAGLTIHGESHRHSSGLWLGAGACNIGRVNYSIVASGTHPSASGVAQDIGFSAVTEINNGRLDARETLLIGSIAGGPLKFGPASLTAAITNVPPAPIEQFKDAAAAISRSASDRQTQARMLQEKAADLLVALVKESPVASLELHAASPDGEAVGKATFGISPSLASDPLIKSGNPDQKEMVAQAWNKYGRSTVELIAPVSFLARLTKADQIKQLEQSGIVIHNGANYICRASFKDGAWLINGRKPNLSAPPGRSNPNARRS
jgi:uncharacterized protein YdgA (DUF945 family)